MSQNWGSGQTSTGSNTSTTNKYFDPNAILGLTNYYGSQHGQQGSLNNSILYGSSAAPGVAPATTAPATTTPATTTPATTTPTGGVLGGTPQRHVAPGTTTPATTTPTTTTTTTPGSNPTGKGPFQPVQQVPSDVASRGETPASAAQSSMTIAPPNQTSTPVAAPIISTTTQQPVDTTPTTTAPGATTPTAASNNGLLSALQGLLNNGGYSATEQQAITEKAAEALAAQKGSNQAALSDSLARSGNAAGYGGAMSSLDNSAAQTASDQARQNT